MINVRWWVLLVSIPLLIGAGFIIEFLVERTVHSSLTLPAPSGVTGNATSVSPKPPPVGRDPEMVAGAAFMAKVTEHKNRLEKNPKDLEALIFLGNANYDITRFDNASQYYKSALEIDPTRIHVRTDLATCYLKLGQTDNALAELQKVLKQDPDYENALYNVGLILLEIKKDNQGAIAAWEKLLKKHPDSDKAQAIRERIQKLKR
jgi:cytochrome c-type biogenesis protein CcmH/NrfG